jgi:uncharacterized membrane protein HdeD (DUF308 family)
MEQRATCRSCGRDLLEPAQRGTAADGTLSPDYCVMCYRAGVFVRPAESRDDATARIGSYLQQRMGVPEGQAHERAEELVTRLAVGPFLLMRGAGAMVDNWWIFLLRGLLAVVFGLLTIWQPMAALAALVLVFGVWAFIDGVAALALAITGWRSWQLALVGLLGIALGLVTLFRPGITAIGLYAAAAAWAIARGILEIVVAIELRRVVRGEAWLVLGGIASLLFGVLLIVLPAAGALALAWLIGLYALVFGGLMIGLAMRLRRLRSVAQQEVTPLRPMAPQPA